jgi:hypothetical protein
VSRELGRYEVVGRHTHRGHPPGSIFEARLDRAAEARATARGSIRLIERVPDDLIPGSYRLPLGWPNQRNTGKEGLADG